MMLGFTTGFEGLKYQYDANLLLEYWQFNPERLFYSVYSLFVAFSIYVGIGLKGVMFLQILFNGYATYLFYKISVNLLKSESISFIIALLFILTPQIQMWNFYLYTESLFISLIVIYTYLLLTFNYKNGWHYVQLFFLLVLLSFLRPIGIGLTIPTILYLVYLWRSQYVPTKKLIILLTTFVVLHLGNFFLNRDNFNEFFGVASERLWIIGAYSGYEIEGNVGVGLYFKAIFNRSLYYFSMMRPYYSTLHNLLFVLFYPVYILAGVGFVKMFQTNRALLIYVIVIILMFASFTSLTYVNYHGRYITPILPFFILSAGFGIQLLANKWRLRKA